jgi:co-chaperonin GroES (HSP10)
MFPTMRGSNVMVRLIQRESQKIGTIEIAGHLDREMQQADVLAVGPGDTTARTLSTTHDLKPGQRVVVHIRSIRKPAATAPEQITERSVRFVHEGETYYIVCEDQIGMILRQPGENLLPGAYDPSTKTP